LVHRASFAVSREQFPGRYEKGADIVIARWHQLRLEVHAARVRAVVDGVEALLVDDLGHPHQQGAVGLWIGDGTRGFQEPKRRFVTKGFIAKYSPLETWLGWSRLSRLSLRDVT